MRNLSARQLRLLMNIWPPFLGSGIRVKRIRSDWRAIDVEMKLHRWNTNYVGTHYGGSLYSMTDPFFMVMLIHTLGRDYIVWDKAATIRFRRPGKGKVSARFELSDRDVEEIKEALTTQEKIVKTFAVEVQDQSGAVVAEVEKHIHVRRKRA